MPLLFYCLTDKGRVNLSKVAHKLGVNVKELEGEIEQLDKMIDKDYRGYKPRMEDSQEIGKLMTKTRGYFK